MDSNKRSIRQILEDKLRIRIKPKPSTNNVNNTANTGNDIVEIVDAIQNSDGIGRANLWDIRSVDQLAVDAETRYRIFDEMESDSIISSALDMYADDTTQYGQDGRIIWAESDNSDIARFANRLIDILNIERDAFSHIRSLVKYGDLYLELFYDDEVSNDDKDKYKATSYNGSDIKYHISSKASTIEEYIEKIENPAIVYEFSRKGKTNGYVRTREDDTNSTEPRHSYQVREYDLQSDVILPSDKFIHIYLPTTDRFSDKVNIQIDINDEDSKVIQYQIVRGKSILNDIYKVYRELKLMEDSILLNRVTRSSITRILSVEVGDMPKSQARETLKRIKSIIEQKNFMDKNDGRYTSQASPGPIDNCIYVPTYNGKGSISTSNLGGDVDIRSIVDLEYFREKLAGALKIPLSYISSTSQENGIGGTSLTKIDSRYARTIKRIQNAYIQGITNLINIFAIKRGLNNYVNNFTIKMVSPSTTEDTERDEMRANRIDIVNSIIDIFNNIDDMSKESKMEALDYLMRNYINDPELADIIRESIDEYDESDEGDEDVSDEESEDGDDFDFGSIGGGSSSSIVSGSDGTDMDFDTGQSETDTGQSDDSGFGDFESDYGEE